MARRTDITPEIVARRWLAGQTIESIALALDTNTTLIFNRLKVARTTLTDLDWDNRAQIQRADTPAAYVSMTDGKAGLSRIREGSVVRATRGIRRGM